MWSDASILEEKSLLLFFRTQQNTWVIHDMLRFIMRNVEYRVASKQRQGTLRGECRFRFGNIHGWLPSSYFAAGCIVCRIFRCTLSQLTLHEYHTMDAMTSNRSVRRPRIRTNSERDRRRQNDRTNYARNRSTFKTKSRVWNEEHKLDVGCKRHTQR